MTYVFHSIIQKILRQQHIWQNSLLEKRFESFKTNISFYASNISSIHRPPV